MQLSRWLAVVSASAVVVSTWTVLAAPAQAGTAPALSAIAAAAAPGISLGPDAVVGEADGEVVVPVTLSAPSSSAVSVLVGYANITANNGFDYTCPAACFSTTVTFAPGQTSLALRLGIVNDAAAEPLESFNVNLSGPTGGTISRAIDRISITDNDTP